MSSQLLELIRDAKRQLEQGDVELAFRSLEKAIELGEYEYIESSGE